MNNTQKERVQNWIDALRSGKYKQTTGRLTRDGAYCCLGVACELSGLGFWKNSQLGPIDLIRYKLHNNSEYSEIYNLPMEVMKQLGLPNTSGFLLGNVVELDKNINGHFDLGMLNDAGFTFNQIADIIQYWLNNQEIIE